MCLFWILFQGLIILYISYLRYLLADSGSQTIVSSCFIENSNGLFLKGYLNLSTCEDPDKLHYHAVLAARAQHGHGCSWKRPIASEISDLHFWYLLLPELSVSAKLKNELWLLLHLCYSLNWPWNLGVVERCCLGGRYDSLLCYFLFCEEGKGKTGDVLSYQNILPCSSSAVWHTGTLQLL